jgi:monoamine oxidase
MRSMRRLFELHSESESTGVPVDELAGRMREARAERSGLQTRREFIAAGAGAAAAAALAARPSTSVAHVLRSAPEQPRIAIVGGGLAGLRCAHLLYTGSPSGPIVSTVYEANSERIGGRCWTLRDYFTNGLIAEHGGYFINSDQVSVRSLAKQLGLEEEDINGGNLFEGDEVFFDSSGVYTLPEANAYWEDAAYRIFKDAIREEKHPEGRLRLDSMSVPEWLDSTEIGSNSRFGKLMMSNVVAEWGGDPSDQSALNLISLLAKNPRSSVEPLGGDDERWHIVGGNDQLVTGMIERLPPGTVQQSHVLVAVKANSEGTVTLTFDVGGALTDVVADFAVFALPFSTLRNVDLSQSGLSEAKVKVIDTMGMGTDAKVQLELTRKTWPALGYAGATYGEWDGLACGWDGSVQLGPYASPALFACFPGASFGLYGLTGAAHGPTPHADVKWALGELDRVYPGTKDVYAGRSYEDHWALDPWVKGAYSYYRVGQYTTYGKIAQAPQRPYLFAGEHTSIENIGFLDGALETGEEAAKQLLKYLKKHHH